MILLLSLDAWKAPEVCIKKGKKNVPIRGSFFRFVITVVQIPTWMHFPQKMDVNRTTEICNFILYSYLVRNTPLSTLLARKNVTSGYSSLRNLLSYVILNIMGSRIFLQGPLNLLSSLLHIFCSFPNTYTHQKGGKHTHTKREKEKRKI